MFREDEHGTLRCPALDELGWVEHGFGTRQADPPVDGWRVSWLRQVHSDQCVVVNGDGGCAGEGDALITARPGVLLSVRTADCLPILIADPKRRLVAAIHAGWRGSAVNLSGKVVGRLRTGFGADPADLLVAVGPGIGVCCYTVGAEVAGLLAEYVPELKGCSGPIHIDLAEVNRRQLLAAGVAADKLLSGAPCTGCRPELFYSYRRERRHGGRMTSVIGIRP